MRTSSSTCPRPQLPTPSWSCPLLLGPIFGSYLLPPLFLFVSFAGALLCRSSPPIFSFASFAGAPPPPIHQCMSPAACVMQDAQLCESLYGPTRPTHSKQREDIVAIDAREDIVAIDASSEEETAQPNETGPQDKGNNAEQGKIARASHPVFARTKATAPQASETKPKPTFMCDTLSCTVTRCLSGTQVMLLYFVCLLCRRPLPHCFSCISFAGALHFF